MKLFLLSFLTLLSYFSFGQFAIVSDKDGYCNVRDSGAIGAKSYDTLHNGHLVFCFEKKGSWTNIDFLAKKQALNGYVYHDRIKFISDYETIPALPKRSDSAIYFEKDSIKIIVTKQKFDKTSHRLSYSKENTQEIQFINAKPYWGTDGDLPRTEYHSIVLFFGSRKIILPRGAIENLFQPSLVNTEVNYDRQNDILYVHASNSDGAGAYDVIWRIEKGVYTERYIALSF